MIFKLPIEIPHSLQKKIIELTIADGFDNPLVLNGQITYIWKSYLFRRIDRETVDQTLLQRFVEGKRRIDYHMRFDSSLPWVWDEHPTSLEFKQFLPQLDAYISDVSRIQVLLLKPGENLPMHTDKIPGNKYQDGVYGMGIDIPENDFHSQNNFLALKLPLSEVEGDNGNPLFETERGELIYNAGNNAFIIDEVNAKHGCLPSNFWRGVVVMDGKLNLEKIYNDKIEMEFK